METKPLAWGLMLRGNFVCECACACVNVHVHVCAHKHVCMCVCVLDIGGDWRAVSREENIHPSPSPEAIVN